MAKPPKTNDASNAQDLDLEEVPAAASPAQAGAELDAEELIRVEAISDGTYPDFKDPRREPYYAIYRNGRVFNAATGRMAPGEVFWMKRGDALTAVHEKGNPFGWIRILAEGELPDAMTEGEAPVPSTTAPRGYGQARRPGLPQH